MTILRFIQSRSLLVAITIAVVWAVLVLGAFFVMIRSIPPFSGWSASLQLQLFQGMVGLAGFGGAGVALFFAGQQISHRFARPLVTVRIRASRGGPHYVQAQPEADPIKITTSAGDQMLLDVEVINTGDTICPAWRVDVWVPGATEVWCAHWQQVTERHVSRQAQEGEALYPDSPLPIGTVNVLTGGLERPLVLELTARILTEHRTHERRLTLDFITEAAAARR